MMLLSLVYLLLVIIKLVIQRYSCYCCCHSSINGNDIYRNYVQLAIKWKKHVPLPSKAYNNNKNYNKTVATHLIKTLLWITFLLGTTKSALAAMATNMETTTVSIVPNNTGQYFHMQQQKDYDNFNKNTHSNYSSTATTKGTALTERPIKYFDFNDENLKKDDDFEINNNYTTDRENWAKRISNYYLLNRIKYKNKQKQSTPIDFTSNILPFNSRYYVTNNNNKINSDYKKWNVITLDRIVGLSSSPSSSSSSSSSTLSMENVEQPNLYILSNLSSKEPQSFQNESYEMASYLKPNNSYQQQNQQQQMLYITAYAQHLMPQQQPQSRPQQQKYYYQTQQQKNHEQQQFIFNESTFYKEYKDLPYTHYTNYNNNYNGNASGNDNDDKDFSSSNVIVRVLQQQQPSNLITTANYLPGDFHASFVRNTQSAQQEQHQQQQYHQHYHHQQQQQLQQNEIKTYFNGQSVEYGTNLHDQHMYAIPTSFSESDHEREMERIDLHIENDSLTGHRIKRQLTSLNDHSKYTDVATHLDGETQVRELADLQEQINRQQHQFAHIQLLLNAHNEQLQQQHQQYQQYQQYLQQLQVNQNQHNQELLLASEAQKYQPQSNIQIPQSTILSKHTELVKTIPIIQHQKLHIPHAAPIKIEIPETAISAEPVPVPIQIPIVKTVAVPIEKDIRIPVERVKMVPVEKLVPHYVEKRVPYTVEKQVPEPFYFNVPFRVPQVHTIVHKHYNNQPHGTQHSYHPHHQYSRGKYHVFRHF